MRSPPSRPRPRSTTARRRRRDAFLERTRLEIELEEAGVNRSRMSVLWSPLHEIRGVFDLMPTEGEEAVAAIASRLSGVPAALEGLRVTLSDEARKGNVVAARQYAEVAEQVRRWTGQSGEAGDFYLGLVDRLQGGDRAELRALAGAASAATAAFGLFLTDELEPQGAEREGVGREVYALASRYFLGAEVDLDETYAWGWAELQRLSDLMDATAERILPGADVDAAVAHLDADPTRVVHGREAFREWMQDLADRTIAAMADVHFDIPAPIRRIECMLAPTNDGGIYYTGPSEDFERPGRMWWSVPDGIEDFHPWREVTTVFHEGVPGHHLQVAQTAYRSDTLNRWQRLMCWCSGHGEGWALYAERLMEELGFLDDPADLLGMLDGQSLRAARVIVDIGMHLELDHPRRQPARPRRHRVPPRRDVDAGAGAGVHAAALPHGRRGHPVRGQALPRPPRPGAVLQGRRAHLARGAGRGPAAPRRRLRPQGLPPRGARPGLARARPAAHGAGAPVTTARVPLVLASASPARLATLRAAGIEPVVIVSGVDETQVDGLPPAELALQLAELKCAAVAARDDVPPDALVLGCDSVLELQAARFGRARRGARQAPRRRRGAGAVACHARAQRASCTAGTACARWRRGGWPRRPVRPSCTSPT